MNSDFKELLEAFTKHSVRFLLVGGYAVVEYTEPRFTKDLDLWVGHDVTNAPRVVAALKEFGAPLFGATEGDFCTPGNVLQIGSPPTRVDILTSIDGVKFDEAWDRRKIVEIDEIEVPVISLEDLIANKESTGRPRDTLEAEMLREARDATLKKK